MSRMPAPTVDQIACIEPTLTGVVDEALVDPNGHMSLPHYVRAGARAVWERTLRLGLDEVLEQGMTFVVADQRARYLHELLGGDRFSAHPVLLTRAARALHTMTYIVDVDRQRVACRIESISVSMSLTTRTGIEIAPAMAVELDAAIHPDAAHFGSSSHDTVLWRSGS